MTGTEGLCPREIDPRIVLMVTGDALPTKSEQALRASHPIVMALVMGRVEIPHGALGL